jgi:hypothetical protein
LMQRSCASGFPRMELRSKPSFKTNASIALTSDFLFV